MSSNTPFFIYGSTWISLGDHFVSMSALNGKMTLDVIIFFADFIYG